MGNGGGTMGHMSYAPGGMGGGFACGMGGGAGCCDSSMGPPLPLPSVPLPPPAALPPPRPSAPPGMALVAVSLTLTSASAVACEHAYKSTDLSLPRQNIVLYSYGALPPPPCPHGPAAQRSHSSSLLHTPCDTY